MGASSITSPTSPLRSVDPESVALAGTQGLVLEEICVALNITTTDVDLNSSFLQLGGDSLLAVTLSAACKRRGISLSVVSVLRSDSIVTLLGCAVPILSCSEATADVLQDVRLGDKARSLRRSSTKPSSPKSADQNTICASTLPDIPRGVQDGGLMTEMQMALIHGSQVKPGNNVINFYDTFRTADVPVMKKSWNAVIEQESIFRTTFQFKEGRGELVMQDAASFIWREVAVYDQTTYETELEDDPLGMQVGSSFKVVTFHKGSQSISTIVWRVHHALIDGYSAKLLYRKVMLFARGQSFRMGTPFTAVARELKALRETESQACRTFWEQHKREAAAAVGKLSLPPPSEQQLNDKNATSSITLQFPLDQLLTCTQQGVTTAALYHGAWALALAMYLDSDVVVCGVVFSGRNIPLPGVEDTIGPLINTLPLHVTLDKDLTAGNYLRRIFHRMIDLDSFQFSLPEHGYSREFSSAMAAEFDMATPAKDDSIQPVGKSYFTATSDVPLNIFHRPDGIVRICYNRAIYRRTDIEYLGEHFRNAVSALLMPNQKIEVCMRKLLSPETREVLLHMGNCVSEDTTLPSIQDDLVTLFERTVAQHPDAVAVEKGEESLTYGRLNARANQIASQISSYVRPGDIVCAHADRSINWITGIYGILKAGAVYSALDKELPPQIRSANYHTAGAKMFLTSASADKTLKPESCSNCFSVEELLLRPCTISWPDRTLPNPSANAYICFTSGSTGKPKGVICSHAGLVAFQKNLEVRLFAQPGIKIAQLMSPAFDGSIHEIFSALSYGATLVLSNSSDPFSHLGRVDSAILTPSIAKTLRAADYPRLQNVYLVGEPVPQHVNDIWSSTKKLFNMYGPTEGTCGATIQRLLPGKRVTIGRPNPSTRIYILDRHQLPVPPGVVGEICVAGVQVAKGYIGRPEETGARFLVDTILPDTGEMMYRTGDRGFWNGYGQVECLGRNDRQIKLRGFRMDLNDLEIRMSQAIPEATAVAITRKDDFLVAMIQPATLDVANVKARIAQFMPVYCLPRHINAVDKFPMTPVGKVDYKVMADDVKPLGLQQDLRPLSTHAERTVAAVWQDALGLAEDVAITKDSNFVALGGHSIMQLLMASKLTHLFGCIVSFQTVLQSLTLRELAQAVERLKADSGSVATALSGPTFKEGEISPIEREWWDKYETYTGSSSFNVSFACTLDQTIFDADRMTAAWNAVLQRHRVLRCRYIEDDEFGVKRVYSQYAPRVHRVDRLSINDEINKPFSLRHDAPIRITISKKHMVVSISHIVCDLTTLQVLLREASSLYNGNQLTSSPRPYEQTTVWSNTAGAYKLNFWTKYLENALEQQLSINKSADRKAYSRGTSTASKVSSSLYARVLDFSDTRKVTLHQLALAAVAIATSADTDKTDVVLGGPYFNRGFDDIETVGLFLEPLPIRVKYAPGTATSSQSFIKSVQNSSQSALAHAMPWNQLLKHMGITPKFPNQPLLDVMVTFHDDRKAAKLSLDGVEPLLTWTEGSKFKLLVEFCAISQETCLLRLEYDTDVFSNASIRNTRRMIVEALDCLVSDMTFTEVKERLRRTACTEMATDAESCEKSLFGVPLSTLKC